MTAEQHVNCTARARVHTRGRRGAQPAPRPAAAAAPFAMREPRLAASRRAGGLGVAGVSLLLAAWAGRACAWQRVAFGAAASPAARDGHSLLVVGARTAVLFGGRGPEEAAVADPLMFETAVVNGSLGTLSTIDITFTGGVLVAS